MVATGAPEMQRYYFDTHNGALLVTDKKGMELDGIERARKRAVSLLPLLVRDDHSDHDEATYEVRVRDANGRAVLNASLSLKVERL